MKQSSARLSHLGHAIGTLRPRRGDERGGAGVSEVTAEATIGADAEQVWEVLGGRFDRLDEWFAGARETRLETPGPMGLGSVRLVRNGPVRLRETVVDWDPPRRLRYEISGLGPAIRDVSSEWLLHPRPDGTTVAQVRTRFEMRGGVLGKTIRPVYAQVLARAGRQLTAGLRRAVEEGLGP